MSIEIDLAGGTGIPRVTCSGVTVFGQAGADAALAVLRDDPTAAARAMRAAMDAARGVSVVGDGQPPKGKTNRERAWLEATAFARLTASRDLLRGAMSSLVLPEHEKAEAETREAIRAVGRALQALGFDA